MIILDWDKIGYHTMMKRIEDMLESSFYKSIEICASPSLDGYHIYAETFSYISPVMRYKIRLALNDDKGRLLKDMFNKRSPIREVSFNYKMKNGTKFHEVKMFKYSRNNPSSEWHLKNQDPKFQTRKFKLELLRQLEIKLDRKNG